MLRKLQKKDSEYMLEWMSDESVICNFQHDFKKETKETIESFIQNSFDEKNQHFTFTDSDDNYLGTISLKNISKEHGNAEYAIVCRRSAQGTGATKKATEEIIKYGFETLKLHRIYLNVKNDNTRAINFYKKCGFKYEGSFEDVLKINNKYHTLDWFAIINSKD